MQTIPSWIYLIASVFSIVIGGIAQYYLGVNALKWVPSLLGGACALFGAPYFLSTATRTRAALVTTVAMSVVVLMGLAAAGFAPSALISFMVYFSLPATAYWAASLPSAARAQLLSRVEALFIYAIPLQLPFCLQQRVSYNIGILNWDAVAGTYGGSPQAGGAGSVMMIMMIVGILLVIDRLQSRRIPVITGLGLIGAGFACIGLSETKAFFILFPLALVVQQFGRIRRNPATSMLWLVTGAAALFLLSQVYQTTNYAVRYGSSFTFSEAVSQMTSQMLNPNYVSYADREVGRVAGLVIWSSETRADPLRAAIGFGLGASRDSTILAGPIVTRFYPLDISATAANQLLWDFGILGTALCAVAFIANFQPGASAGARPSVRPGTLNAILAVLLATAFYTPAMLDENAIKLTLSYLLTQRWASRATS